MHETPEDLAALQDLLDRTYAAAGSHLASIHTPNVRLTAEEVVQRYEGMKVLVVATVSADGRPFTGPVDSFLYRGQLHFGTAQGAVRTRHLSANPAVSASHVVGEETVITVHGTVRPLDLRGADAGFAAVTKAHYGQGWDEWDDQPATWAIEADRMFAADMSRHQQPAD